MQNGFTLIELLVSIAVIIIVSSAVMVGRNGEEQKMFLRTTAFTLSQNLREYQEKALSGEDVDCPNSSFKKVCGFGINFKAEDDFYTPFVDCASDCSLSTHVYNVGIDKVSSVVSLSKAKIKSVTGPGPGPDFNVVFAPPDPVVYLYDKIWGNELLITLCLKGDSNITRTIKINNAGKIETQ